MESSLLGMRTRLCVGQQRRLAVRTPFRGAAQVVARLERCGRGYATIATAGSAEKALLLDIDASKLTIERTTSPGTLPPSSELKFGETFSDHMLSVPWSARSGWGAPRIHPYGPLPLYPSSMVLQYALTAYEGLKAYRDETGKIMIFRPDMNMKRLNRSVARISLPNFDGAAVIELMKELIRLDAGWIPSEAGHSLYLRPTIIATQKSLYVGPSNEALLYIICSPVGPYYKGGFKPISLLGTTQYVRAAPGGTGSFKLSVNYAPGIVPQVEAAEMGYDQNLWLFGPEHYLTEVGTMNMLLVLKREDGATELVTPPLDDMILPGVTRDSVLQLAREHASGKHPIAGLPDNLVVSERKITMAEVKAASKEGRLLELFGAGTAAIVCPVERIGYEGKDITVPTGESGAGPIAQTMLREIVGRQYGKIPSEWCVVVKP